jgi:hypothetical protein
MQSVALNEKQLFICDTLINSQHTKRSLQSEYTYFESFSYTHSFTVVANLRHEYIRRSPSDCLPAALAYHWSLVTAAVRWCTECILLRTALVRV